MPVVSEIRISKIGYCVRQLVPMLHLASDRESTAYVCTVHITLIAEDSGSRRGTKSYVCNYSGDMPHIPRP